jgi:Ser/Thr protein kinase RdoA (MazF antagonist)
MDVGTANIVLNQGTSILLDFGFAGMAPIGADLHTVRRYGGPAWSGELVDAYAEVFAAKGIEVDTAAILRTLDAHFAARYRNLRFPAARNRETFDAALATSLALIGAPAG